MLSTRLRSAALVLLIGTACSCNDPQPEPPPPRRECLPVVEECGDCITECVSPYVLTGVLVDELEPTPPGEMGAPERSLVRAEHCVGDDCRPVYRRRLGGQRMRNCYALCTGRQDFPTCVTEGERCTAVWPQE